MKKSLTICVALIIGITIGLALGIPRGKNQATEEMFSLDYDAAMNYIRTTIGKRMAEATPFYISDLGIRFTPRGTSITSIRFIGDAAAASSDNLKSQISNVKLKPEVSACK
jgi:hypothetical protein